MYVDYRLIGLRIKQKRKACGQTQERLAEALSVTVGYVSQMERGVTKVNLEMLAAIAQQLNTDISFFVTGVNETHGEYLQEELLEKWQNLTPNSRQLAMDLIEAILRRQT